MFEHSQEIIQSKPFVLVTKKYYPAFQKDNPNSFNKSKIINCWKRDDEEIYITQERVRFHRDKPDITGESNPKLAEKIWQKYVVQKALFDALPKQSQRELQTNWSKEQYDATVNCDGINHNTTDFVDFFDQNDAKTYFDAGDSIGY
jgi:hypothetical protein